MEQTVDAQIADIRRWLGDHEKSDNERFEQLMAVLQPMSDTFKAASTLGKWAKGAIVLLSLVVGTIVAWQSLK